METPRSDHEHHTHSADQPPWTVAKARTRAALIRAAQTLIAQGRMNVPILEITQAADVGMGSFYNRSAVIVGEPIFGLSW